MKHTRWNIWGIMVAALAVCLLTLSACGEKPPSGSESTGTDGGTSADPTIGTTADTDADETAG